MSWNFAKYNYICKFPLDDNYDGGDGDDGDHNDADDKNDDDNDDDNDGDDDVTFLTKIVERGAIYVENLKKRTIR